jgi:Fur family ferric uptake transcriptional regulator
MAMSDGRAHVDEAAALLRSRGYRVTPQRVWVLAALLHNDEHVTAEEVLQYVRRAYAQMNSSTVYRTLEILRHGGLASGTDLGDGRVRYHLGDKARHHHLVCGRCGATIEVKDFVLQPLRETFLKEYRFRASLNHLAIPGFCERCRQ